MNSEIILKGVSEYAESYDVRLQILEPREWNDLKEPRIVIEAWNEGGCSATNVDLLQLLDWVKENQGVLNNLISKTKENSK